MPPMPLMTALDADGDGTLSKAEIANASKALMTLDKDKDGVLSEEERTHGKSMLICCSGSLTEELVLDL